MPATAMQKKHIAKRTRTLKKIPVRTPLEPARNFGPEEGAFAAGVSVSTLRRAIALNQEKPDQGLAHYRVGRRIILTGAQIQDWIARGGQTGRSLDDVIREKEEAEARRKM